MKVIVKTLLVALTALLATAQRGLEFSFEGVIVDATTGYIQQAGEEYAFRPMLRALQVETVIPADVNKPAVIRKLKFPLHETVCHRTEDQTGKECPLKRNGKSFMCNLEIYQPVLDFSIPQSTDITCEPMTTADQLQHKIRMRRDSLRVEPDTETELAQPDRCAFFQCGGHASDSTIRSSQELPRRTGPIKVHRTAVHCYTAFALDAVLLKYLAFPS
ncbi:hypothetical protein SKAU_G00386570 [Synaphobranchus kaupii]|uniref:Cathelicidin n=1 Tax=Synaphobranchus kaupii TaxID=118154 RepID=A0A9Q1EER4_SYNKA|nr:hypothetical protein SKAU_G00386570 [Synaphobranchus kaupii]